MVDQVKEHYDVETTWLPYFLHPEIPEEGTQPSEAARAHYAPMWRRLEQRAQEAGIPIERPEYRPNTRRALEATEYAREQGRHDAFHRILFDMYFRQGKDIHDWNVLRSAAEEAGLDPDEMQQKTAEGEYREVVEGHYRRARSLGITGIPTHILDDRYAIVGAQPLEAFEQAIERLRSGAQQAQS